MYKRCCDACQEYIGREKYANSDITIYDKNGALVNSKSIDLCEKCLNKIKKEIFK